jgi:hypothetical protein
MACTPANRALRRAPEGIPHTHHFGEKILPEIIMPNSQTAFQTWPIGRLPYDDVLSMFPNRAIASSVDINPDLHGVRSPIWRRATRNRPKRL